MENQPGTAAWKPGDRLTVRGAAWTVVRCTPFAGGEALRITSPAHGTRTLLLPFDRPRAARARPFAVVRPRRWAHRARELLAEAHPYGGLRFCPAGIRLLAYQLEPAIAMLRDGYARILIADGVGLGKTIQAGLIASELAGTNDAFRAMILTPAGLRHQWAGELARRFGLDSLDADARWLRATVRDIPADVNPWSIPGVYLSSFDFVKRPEALRPLEEVRWDLLVVDEAHAATIGTDRRAAIDAIASRSRRVVLLTATPHPGDPEQFAALCRIGAGPDSPAPVIFQRSRAAFGDGRPRRSTLLAVRLTPAEHRMHRLLEAYTARVWHESVRSGRPLHLASVVLRKRALSSPASLSLSIRRRIELLAGVPPQPAQLPLPWAGGEDEDPLEDAVPDHVLASAGLSDPDAERQMLREIADAADRAAVVDSKLRVLGKLLERVPEPAIVFTEYRDTLERLQAFLTAAGRPVTLVHGGLSPAERRAAIDSLAERGRTLLATDAASEGLNLQQTSRIVIHYELPWNPSRMEQRAGRVDRIGQTRRVHEIALVASDTAESLVLGPLARRAAGWNGSTGLATRLSESRIAEMLIGGLPLDDRDVSAAAAADRVDYGEAAAAEAARLQTHRRLTTHADSPRRTARCAACVPVSALSLRTRDRRTPPDRTPVLRPGLALVFDLSLVDGRSRLVHDEVVAIHVPFPPPPALRTAAGIGSWTRTLLHETRSTTLARLDEVATDRIAAVDPVYSRATAARRRREREVSATLPSAARQLVQAGLFDRRALTAAVLRQRAAADLRADAELETEAQEEATRLTASTELRAVLLIGAR